MGHIQTTIKTDMRNPSVNGTMSQFLDVKIVGIMTFEAHLLTNNLQFTNY